MHPVDLEFLVLDVVVELDNLHVLVLPWRLLLSYASIICVFSRPLTLMTRDIAGPFRQEDTQQTS